jgi:hypothetical protein
MRINIWYRNIDLIGKKRGFNYNKLDLKNGNYDRIIYSIHILFQNLLKIIKLRIK